MFGRKTVGTFFVSLNVVFKELFGLLLFLAVIFIGTVAGFSVQILIQKYPLLAGTIYFVSMLALANAVCPRFIYKYPAPPQPFLVGLSLAGTFLTAMIGWLIYACLSVIAAGMIGDWFDKKE